MALDAGVLTAVVPPATFQAASVGNATATDLELHTNTDETEWLAVEPGYERLIPIHRTLFVSTEIACWLKSVGGGTAVIVWL